MTSILVVAPALPDAPDLVSDLERAGLRVLDRCGCAEMVQSAVRHAPDVVIIWDPYPGAEPNGRLFTAVRLLTAVMARPLLVFTSEVSAEAMEASVAAGIDSWVVNGYSRDRLRALVQYTQTRSRHAQAQRTELSELKVRYEERRLVDRAKGILMSARQVNEDEAFRLLRSASMHAKQRIGQMSQQVIDAAHYADAINRAGRLRMLSQRIVKLYALATASVEVASSRALLADSVAQVEANLELLGRIVSRPSFGDLLDAALGHWRAMQHCLAVAPVAGKLPLLNTQAEALLQAAESLTSALEGAGLATTLHVINVSGRQRMHAQRLAKLALLAAPASELARTAQDFDEGLAYLEGIPLSTPGIRAGLVTASHAWQQLRSAAAQAQDAAACIAMAASSEALLDVFDQLTLDYERSMQVLIG